MKPLSPFFNLVALARGGVVTHPGGHVAISGDALRGHDQGNASSERSWGCCSTAYNAEDSPAGRIQSRMSVVPRLRELGLTTVLFDRTRILLCLLVFMTLHLVGCLCWNRF